MEREMLHTVVSSFFETESHRLVTDEHGKPIMTIEAWKRIALSLKLLDIPKHKPIESEIPTTVSSAPALIELDISKTDRLIYNVHEFSFVNFYPQVIVRMDLDLEDLDIFRYVLDNRGDLKKKMSIYGYHALKQWINFYYGVIGKADREIADRITGTARATMQKMVNAIGDSQIYADTDSIFCDSLGPKLERIKSYASYLGLPFEVDHYAAAIFFGKKKYILFRSLDDVVLRGIQK